MKKMIVCQSCAAEFDAALVRCPYCGTGYAPAEEKEYMGRLEEIRTELEGHKGDGDKSLRKGVGSLSRTVLVIAVICILFLLGGFFFSHLEEQKKSEQAKAEFLRNQGIIMQEDSER